MRRPDDPATEWLVLHHTRGARSEEVGRRLIGALGSAGVPHHLATGGDETVTASLVAAAIEAGYRRFAAVGGDGAANRLLNLLMVHDWTEPPLLAVVATGEPSDFIRTFALPARLEDAVRRLATDAVYRCDVGVVEGGFGRRFFLNAVETGTTAAAGTLAARLPHRLGRRRYNVALWLRLPRFSPGPVDVDLGRRRIAGDAMGAVVANGQFIAGGLNIAPQAAVGDGLLDVEVFLGSRRHLISVMPRVARGLHLRDTNVARGRVAEVTVTVPDHWPVAVDGRQLGRGSVTVSVLPAAVDFKI